MTDKRDRNVEPEALAAEYALGLLTGEELRDAESRVSSDPQFAADVARWRGRLAALHEETDPAAPPADLWTRIDRATAGPVASNDNFVLARRKLAFWRAATGAMTAAAASLALVIGFAPRPVPAPQPRAQVRQPAAAPMVAMLGDKSRIQVVASWDPTARQLVLAVPGNVPADSSHSRELWVIPADGKPRSLGIVPSGKQSHVRLGDALADLLQHGATIAISIEPPGGSPTGAPTGPVVASGPLAKA